MHEYAVVHRCPRILDIERTITHELPAQRSCANCHIHSQARSRKSVLSAMANSSSTSTNYHRVQPSLKPPNASLPWQAPEPGRSSKASWRAPATILFALLIGLGFALAHHFMGLSLNNKPVAQVDISQAWISRFSTALAFLVKLALATSVGAAYTQRQWQRLRQQNLRTSEIDALTSVLANAFSFLSSTVWARHPLLALMALVSWYE
jgi:hypothetical protein